MREKPIEDFFSRNGRLREDNLMMHDLWLVQVKSPEESKYPWDYYKILTTIPGERAFGPPDPACPLVSRGSDHAVPSLDATRRKPVSRNGCLVGFLRRQPACTNRRRLAPA